MKRRPMLPTIYGNVSDFNEGGSVKYMAHLVTQGLGQNCRAYALGTETTGSGGTPSNHPDQVYWEGKMNRLRNAIQNSASNNAPSISRIEIDCTLLPCDGQYDGCLYRVPALIRGLLNSLKALTGQERFALIANTDPGKIPLRIFSHRPENEPPKVIFCTIGDSNQQLQTAYANRDSWIWVEYRNNEYQGPNVANGNRQFSATPNLA